MNHSFDIKYAEKYGINCAIILNNLIFWAKKNSANNTHVYDGSVWVYNSIRAWKELFPYMTENHIRNALKKLEEEGIIISGNYNEHKYDQTKWYSIIDESICENNQIHLSILTNGIVKNNKPIPIVKSIVISNNNNIIVESEISDADIVAKYLHKNIVAYNPKFVGKWESWSKDISYAINIDKRTKEELINCINWIYNSKKGEFWIPNILSGKKLREKYNAMNMQAMGDTNLNRDNFISELFRSEK